MDHSDRMAIMALADRCERATGPDPDLDRDIWATVVAKPPANLKAVGRINPLAYTGSLDAAKSLVDPRALWAHGSMEDGPFARLCWPQANGGYLGGYHEASAATVALATCSAALRAMALTD